MVEKTKKTEITENSDLAEAEWWAIEKAKIATSPELQGALLTQRFHEITFGSLDLVGSETSLLDKIREVQNGDLKEVEAMLLSQAHSLNIIFTTLSFKATKYFGTSMELAEKFLRQALKAQAQSRATLETLGNIKNPPVIYAKQANITQGPQQVNNGTAAPVVTPPINHPSHAEKIKSEPNELLEGNHGERLDTRTTGTASETDQTMEAVGAVNRPPKR